MKENESFARGVAHFNAGEFFEAHEVWEEIWLASHGSEKAFLQGLIQIAAAFHHHARGNTRGLNSLLIAGLAKIEGAPNDYRDVALEEFRAEVSRWLEVSSSPGSPVPKREKLPRIRRATRGKPKASTRIAPKEKRGG